jgi:uridine phosphorylase
LSVVLLGGVVALLGYLSDWKPGVTVGVAMLSAAVMLVGVVPGLVALFVLYVMVQRIPSAHRQHTTTTTQEKTSHDNDATP